MGMRYTIRMRQQLKDFFVPHEGNDYKPNSLEKAAVVGMVVLILLSFTIANLQSFIWMSSEWMVSSILPAVIVDLTNEERENVALGDLRRNATLDAAATLKAQHMASNEYFAHYSPEGISPWHWFNVAGYKFVHAGENLAIYFSDSDAVVDAWMNSPTHRANIVNKNYTEIGVGTARGTYEGFDTVYVVQLFGTPAKLSAASPVETQAGGSAAIESPEPIVLAETESVVAEPEVAEELPATTSVPVLPLIASSEEVVETLDDTEIVLSTDRDPIVATTSESESSTTEVHEVEIAEIAVHEDDSVVLYSDLISTSTGGVPASIDPGSGSSQSTPPILAAATQPHVVLQVVYSVIALFVFFALMLSIFIEIRRQHPIQIAYSTALVAAMFALFYVHSVITAGAVIM